MAIRQESEVFKLKGTIEDLQEDGAILRHPNDPISVFTKCCKVKLTQADRFPVMIYRPERKFGDQEEVIGHVWICRNCHRRTPHDSVGHTSAFRGDYAKRLPPDILKDMDRSSRRNMNGLSCIDALGPGMAYSLIHVGNAYESYRFTSDPIPVDLEPSANAYQPDLE